MKKIIFIIMYILIIIEVINFNSIIVSNKHIINNVVLNSEEKNDVDLRIKLIEIFNGKDKIDFDFNPNIKKYNIRLNDSHIDIMNIKAELYDSNVSFYEGYGNRNIKLNYGENIINLITTTLSGESEIYTIVVSRPKGLASSSRLSYLKINNKEVKLSNDELEYLVVLDKDNIQTEIDAVVDTKGVTVEYNDINLEYGNNDLNISLVDNDNITLDYKIHIIRLENEIYKKFEKIEIENIVFQKDKYEYILPVDDINNDIDINIYPNNIMMDVESIEKSNDNSKIINVKIFDDCETKTYTFHLIPKTKLPENNKAPSVDIEKKNNYSVYYIFLIISVIISIISICYSIIVKKKKAKKILSIE